MRYYEVFSSSSQAALKIWPEVILSHSGFLVSLSKRIRSKRDKRGFPKQVLHSSPVKHPPAGLVAAMTEQRLFNVLTMPALAIEIVCCSIASCTEVLSCEFIVVNSSTQQTPPSASTSAPASKCQPSESCNKGVSINRSVNFAEIKRDVWSCH